MASKKTAKKTNKKPITTGAEKLTAWMNANGYSVNRLARALDVERFSLTRILEGQEKHVNLEFAFRAEKLTKGEISAADFLQETKQAKSVTSAA